MAVNIRMLFQIPNPFHNHAHFFFSLFFAVLPFCNIHCGNLLLPHTFKPMGYCAHADKVEAGE